MARTIGSLPPEMIHLYDPERVDATRDVSQMTPSMLRLKMLSGYEEAAVINARVSACKMGFYETDSGDGYQGDDKDANGNPIQSAEPGQMEKLPPGWKFNSYDPKYPDQQHGPFVEACLRGVAAGLGTSYATLSQDLSSVNFSSIRAGLIEEREEWKEGQVWLIENLFNPVFANWLEMAPHDGSDRDAAAIEVRQVQRSEVDRQAVGVGGSAKGRGSRPGSGGGGFQILHAGRNRDGRGFGGHLRGDQGGVRSGGGARVGIRLQRRGEGCREGDTSGDAVAEDLPTGPTNGSGKGNGKGNGKDVNANA